MRLLMRRRLSFIWVGKGCRYGGRMVGRQHLFCFFFAFVFIGSLFMLLMTNYSDF